VDQCCGAVDPKFQVINKATDESPALRFEPILTPADQTRPGKLRHDINKPRPLGVNVAGTDKRFDEKWLGGKLTADAILAPRAPLKFLAQFTQVDRQSSRMFVRLFST
jgi:hypothetical protein